MDLKNCPGWCAHTWHVLLTWRRDGRQQDLVCPNKAFAVVLHSEIHVVSTGIVHCAH